MPVAKLAKKDEIKLDGRSVAITHPEKILFPESGITKRDLVDYYQRIAPLMLPYLRGRPLVMQRYPDGIGKQSFFQKAVADYYPDWIRTVVVTKEGGTVEHAVCDDAATLVYLANQACITLHTWLSRADRLDFPDHMIFDLDPADDDFSVVIDGARRLKKILDDLELPAYLKTTGSRGLHVVVPLDRKEDFDAVRSFARELADLLAGTAPDKFTTEQRKIKRAGRVFIDINRNAYAQTAVAPFSVRARENAPISFPISWSELRKGLRPDGFTIKNVFTALDKREDPWSNFWRDAVSLKKAQRRLGEQHAPDRLPEEKKIRRNA